MKKPSSNIIRIVIILISIFALWNTIIIKPLKLFTVFLHELGHFVSAKLVGYSIIKFQVSFNEGGFVSYMPQNQTILKDILVGSSGYLGSLFFAVLILGLKNSKYKRFLLVVIALLFTIISVFYSGISFTLLFSILVSVFVFVVIKLNKPALETIILEITGFSCIIYAIYDTFVDTIVYYFIMGKNVQSDSVGLQMTTGIPAIIWGILWLCLSIFVVYKTFRKEIHMP